MYEIWSLGHKPFEDYTNAKVIHMIMYNWSVFSTTGNKDGGWRISSGPSPRMPSGSLPTYDKLLVGWFPYCVV